MSESFSMHRVREWVQEAWGTGLTAAWAFGERAEGKAEKAEFLSHSSISSFLHPAALFTLSHHFLSSFLSFHSRLFSFPPLFPLFLHLSFPPSWKDVETENHFKGKKEEIRH